jgi:hypothetical protein
VPAKAKLTGEQVNEIGRRARAGARLTELASRSASRQLRPSRTCAAFT